ncbi:MAG: hypothetical protein H6619_05720 [Deltaproteobacteria bacterium]|nr:hypothetical protein [Deltaproteobacteria bacterium]
MRFHTLIFLILLSTLSACGGGGGGNNGMAPQQTEVFVSFVSQTVFANNVLAVELREVDTNMPISGASFEVFNDIGVSVAQFQSDLTGLGTVALSLPPGVYEIVGFDPVRQQFSPSGFFIVLGSTPCELGVSLPEGQDFGIVAQPLVLDLITFINQTPHTGGIFVMTLDDGNGPPLIDSVTIMPGSLQEEWIPPVEGFWTVRAEVNLPCGFKTSLELPFEVLQN